MEPTQMAIYESSIKKNIELMEVIVTNKDDKQLIFKQVQMYLAELNFTISTFDFNRPWGGFFVIDETDTEKFLAAFFPELKQQEVLIGNKLSPKILVVAPNKRLSWQYHHRRAELWKLIAGQAGIVTSHNDEELTSKHLTINDIVVLQQGERHRLIGLQQFGIIAEIWQHTDIDNPSNEDDIVRLQDDFGRSN